MARCDFLLAFYSGLRSRWNYCQVIIRLNKQNRNPRQQNKEKQEEHSGIYVHPLSLCDAANKRAGYREVGRHRRGPTDRRGTGHSSSLPSSLNHQQAE